LATETWQPTDGDTFVTQENFVFYVFGYEHPEGRVFSFLKYIPFQLKSLFPIRFLRRSWKLGRTELVRPEKLYSSQNFQRILETFRKNFPHYIYFCPFRGKEIVSSPTKNIKRIYVPRECLQRLLNRKKKDALQILASELAITLSEESHVPLDDLGIRGSIALNMHTTKSDVDLAVYGSQNFRKLEKAIAKLDSEGALSYVCTTRLDKVRKHRGRYKNTIFMYNAVRKIGEITSRYGEERYSAVKPLTFNCQVIDDSEAMFRPAICQITGYHPLDSTSTLAKEEIPIKVTSMIGSYRNVARRGEKVKVSGTLEQVEDVETGKIYHQVVIGTGTREDEYIWPIKD